MPDYIYLLENRLSVDQRNALSCIREVARGAEMILFLTGDAVRDLTSGHAVHELEVAVHGDALKIKEPLEKAGAAVWGEDADFHSLFLCFPGTVRVDVISTHRAEYAKPGRPTYHAASIQEDLRRRDFTVNAMAISLNEGSFGLLMDPLNGAADIEARMLRLVSNYGFLEEPSLLIRATRYKTRLGWELDPRTQMRYENAKAEGVIEHLSSAARSRELEQIGHEEEGLAVLKALEAEGWMEVLFPEWKSSKADAVKLQALHELAVELLLQGVHADMSAAQMELLTAGLSAKDLAAFKKSLLRPGFVAEWNGLDALASGFQKVLLSKPNATPSASYKLFTSYDPEAVLWLGFTSKAAAVQDRYRQFLKVWPEARQRIPYALMQEMRITAELPGYADLVRAIFLELIDGGLSTPEEMRAYLEPHSPPPPPPKEPVKRPRVRREAKLKSADEEGEEAEETEEEEESLDGEDGLDDLEGGEDDTDLDLVLTKADLHGDEDANEPFDETEGKEEDEDESEALPEPAFKKSTGKPEPARAEARAKPASAAAKTAPPVAAKPAVSVPVQAKSVIADKPAPVAKAKSAGKPKPAPAATRKPLAPAGKSVKPAKPVPAKAHTKPEAKPAKGKPAKPAGKKPAPSKSGKKH